MSGPYNHTYLLNRQADAERLKRRAYDAFAAAVRSRQLVAFTGSHASRHLGYPSWQSMTQNFIERLAGRDPGLAKVLKERVACARKPFDDTDLMDLAEISAHIDRRAEPGRFLRNRMAFAENFAMPLTCREFSRRPDVSSALVHDLGIRRIITLNYDLEHEWSAFVGPQERQNDTDQLRAEVLAPYMAGSDSSKQRLVPGFGKVLSEVLQRNSSAALASFALGDTDERCRILHLHGRVDAPETMIVSRRDYRDLYSLAGFSKLPFEYGLRTILAGNPILFVGLGMTEIEINRHFERFLSDNPNRRSMPMFLLWNSQENDDADRAFRMLYDRKLGISVLFDKEVARFCEDRDYDAGVAAAGALASGFRMQRPLQLLARWCALPAQLPATKDLRSPQAKFEGKKADDTIHIWRTEGSRDAGSPGERAKLAAAVRSAGPLLAITGKPGSGRGRWTGMIVQALEEIDPPGMPGKRRVVVINGSFATETDSIFGILSGVYDGQTAFDAGESRLSSTKRMADLLMELAALGKSDESDLRELVIIINGMERFIAHNGTALSAELDMLIRLVPSIFRTVDKDTHTILASQVRLILVGSPRLLRYIKQIAPRDYGSQGPETGYFREGRIRGMPGSTQSVLSIEPADGKQFQDGDQPTISGVSFLPSLADRFGLRALMPLDVADPRQRKHFLEELGIRIGKLRGDLAFEVLRAMAFIGQPVERHVLPHVVRKLPGYSSPEQEFAARCDAVERELDFLLQNGVIMKIAAFPGQGARVGLHKAMVAEIRERYGLPLSDARLASGFNIGLYAAQPLESILPDEEWHDNLARMVDYLCGQHQDPAPADEKLEVMCAHLLRDPACVAALRRQFLDGMSAAQLARLACARQSDCLRAALSLLRSFYSTSSLLMHQHHELDMWLRNAPLTDHAERLRRLIRLNESSSVVRRLLQTVSDAAGADSTDLEKSLGAAAFYADDLCWLYNELGVVLLTQGTLFDAREALETALVINNDLVEFGERHQNWRRIMLNLVQVAIDQGHLLEAEEMLREVETSIESDARLIVPERLWESVLGTKVPSFRYYALRRFATHGGERSTRSVDRHFPANLFLGLALVLGYRALCHRLRGSLSTAEEYFDEAVKLLDLLGEQRAFAIFQRHRISLLRQLGRLEDALEAQKLCVSSAGPSRQADIDHSGRLALGEHGFYVGREQQQWRNAQILPQLKETLRYATACDMYRLQVEALQLIGYLQHRMGDTDSALAYVADAMAVASRNGFVLRKNGLRLLLGRILASRNDKDAARAVLKAASQLGTGMGYARSAELAENELVRIVADQVDQGSGLPRRD